MRMETSLSQKQVMQLRLAPQILQRIEVLQLATLDLKGLVEREMEMNPTIEIETQDPVSTPSAVTVSPRLRPSSIVEHTITSSAGRSAIPETNERSILISSTGRRWR